MVLKENSKTFKKRLGIIGYSSKVGYKSIMINEIRRKPKILWLVNFVAS